MIYSSGMPEAQIAARGGAVRWRTITVGRGKKRKTLKIAVVRTAGKRGGHTIAGRPHG